MLPVWGHFRQRHEREGSFVQPRVRNDERLRVDPHTLEQQDIEVDLPRTVAHLTPLATSGSFDVLKGSEQCPGGSVRQTGSTGVQEWGLIRDVERIRFVHPGET